MIILSLIKSGLPSRMNGVHRIHPISSKGRIKSWQRRKPKKQSIWTRYCSSAGIFCERHVTPDPFLRTGANTHDVTMVPKLLTGEEDIVYGDSGYLGAEKREDAVTVNTAGKRIRYKINRRPTQSKNKSVRSKAQIRRREHEKSSVRAKIEHVFGVVKGQLLYRKTRYRGLRKQTAKLNMMFALANLLLADRPCLTV